MPEKHRGPYIKAGYRNQESMACELAQQVQVLVAKPDGLSLTLEIHIVERET